MVRPCVGIPRFRGVFRLPHTPHILPLTIAVQGLEIHANNADRPRTAYAARSDVFPPGRGWWGSSSVHGGRYREPGEAAKLSWCYGFRATVLMVAARISIELLS